MKRLSFFVTVVLIAAMLFTSGCSENAPAKDTMGKTKGNVTENVTERATEGVNESVTEGVKKEVKKGAKEGTTEGVVGTENKDGYNPVIKPENYVKVIDNSYFPLTPGKTRVYEGKSEDETMRSEIFVTNETRMVIGVNTTVIRDRVFTNGELSEETFDWYAQDIEGNVWYFGEDSKEYEKGKVASTAGSWEAGVGGAQPGIIMKRNPRVGDIYRQEYLSGKAEDMAEVITLNESVSIAYGSFENCLKTKEWTPLEPGIEESKYFASGIGLVMEMAVKGGSEKLELVKITTP